MLTQSDAVKQAWQASERTLDIVINVDGVDYPATNINSLSYDAGAFTGDSLGIGSNYENSISAEFSSVIEAFKAGLTVKPKIGIKVNGKFEYTPLGVFIISEVNRDRNNNLTTIKALDQMVKLEEPYTSALTYPAKILDVVAEIANQGGVKVNQTDLTHLPSLPNLNSAITGQTLRAAIGWIAQFYAGFAAFDREGQLTIRTTATPDYTIDPGEYMQGGLTKNEVAYQTGGIKVTVNNKTTDSTGQETDSTQTLQAGETTGSQIELTNNVMTEQALATVWNGIKDITYYPYTLNWFGNPGIEAGDWVTLTDTHGNQFNVPINQYTMSFNGGLESTISATQSSSTAGGYAYTGSAGTIKNMIEELQVRHTATGNIVYPPSYQGEPKNPKKGDVWYKQNGNNVEMWIYQEENGKSTWVKTPLDGEVKAELQALGKQTNEDLTRVKSELSSTAESQWESAKTATSETNERLTSLQAENSASLADLYNTANSLHASADSMRGSLTAEASELGENIESTRNSLRTATSEVGDSLKNVQSSLAAVDVGLRNDISKANNSMTATGNSLANKAASLATATSELQAQTGKISGSLSTADSMIMFNSNAIAEVKKSANAIEADLVNTKGNVANVQAKADSLQSQVTDNKNNISSVKLTADGLEQTVKKGSRNLIKTAMELSLDNGDEKAGDYVVGLVNAGNGGWHEDDTQAPLSVSPPELNGQKLTVSFDVLTSDTSQLNNMYTNLGLFDGQGNRQTELENVSLANHGIVAKQWTRFSTTFDIPQGWTSDNVVDHVNGGVTDHTGEQITATLGAFFYSVQFKNASSVPYKIKCAQAEIGPNATAFAAPDSSISQLIQTSKELKSLISDNDGNISQLRQTANILQMQIASSQGDISALEQTAGEIKQSVKDNQNNITSVSQKADSIKASLTNTQGNVASLQATASGLQSSVSDNKKDISSIRQTTNSLQSQISNANGDISNVKQTANDLHSQVADNKNNISAVRQTATALTSQMQNANGDISQLKQTAGSLSQTVLGGSRNLIKTAMELSLDNGNEKVGDYVVGLVNPGHGGWHEEDTQAPLSILPPNLDGQKLTVGFDVLVSDASQLGSMYVNVGVFNGQWTRLLELTNASFENEGIVAGKWTRISNTFDIPQGWVNATITGHDGSTITGHTGNQIEATLGAFVYGVEFKNTSSIGYKVKCVQAEIGPNATAFAAPDSSISQLIQTSKELKSLISDNDGNISQLRQTANILQMQVADNRGSISSLQLTAQGLTSDVTNAKDDISSFQLTAQGLTSDVKNAKDNISSLQVTANGLTTSVSNAEHNISSLQVTANRLSATVGDANSGLVAEVNAVPTKITSAITASQQAKVITTATDVHNMKTAGYYLLKGTLTNSPVNAWAFLRVITSDSGDRIYHRIWKDNASTVYTEEWTGSWSSWATHINSDNLKSNVITAINQSTEGVSITGNKITLDGNVNVAPGFTLSADYITTGTMTADRIKGGTLDFNSVNAYSISADSITGGTLNFNYVDAQNISADSITTGTMHADRIAGGTLDFDYITVNNLSANDIKTGTMSADRISGGTLDFNNVNAQNINADSIKAGTLKGNGITFNLDKGSIASEKAGVGSALIQNGAIDLKLTNVGDLSLESDILAGNITLWKRNKNDENKWWHATYSATAIQLFGTYNSNCIDMAVESELRIIIQDDNNSSWIGPTRISTTGSVSAGSPAGTLSRLSQKRNVEPVAPAEAVKAIMGTDMYAYNYLRDLKDDGEDSQRYISLIIDDVNDKPKYNADPMLVSNDRKYRYDANLLGYHHVALQSLIKEVQTLKTRIKELERIKHD